MSDIIEIDPNRKVADYSVQLIQILSMWGFKRDFARRIAANMATTIASMSDAEFEEVRAGARIKGGIPEMGPANDEGLRKET